LSLFVNMTYYVTCLKRNSQTFRNTFDTNVIYVRLKYRLFVNKLLHKDVYRGAGKSLSRPGRKQATATEDFDFHISYLLSILEEN